ncbi:cinnamoyl-CoA reductase 1-like [Impatiens glandulifera]|uniref:cinnamoyl-CoA reductase 1-like n=1 Tax=Impatiens glandulifera TaxID=253017 RepID=UPI001FB17361|nr:cinnamoyl-CoA reductase 1-like [Impatiens glandulifera]
MESKGTTVCVTGAGGYVASWLIKLLLSNGYTVHGTVRDPDDLKNAHLKNLENAEENLKLFKADLLDYESIAAAINGCSGVFHVASPVILGSVPNPEVEIVEIAVKGTLNVLKASKESANVKRVLFVSSVAAACVSSTLAEGGYDIDETCWSDKEFCRKTNNWYCLSKTEAEMEALEFAKGSGLDLVTVCPSLVFGPKLQSTINDTSLVLINFLKVGNGIMENTIQWLVDVRDVVNALLIVYEKAESSSSSEGLRYICNGHSIWTKDMVEMMKNIYPHSNYPDKFTDEKKGNQLSSEKLQKLGWSFRPLEETLVDSVNNFKEDGILD